MAKSRVLRLGENDDLLPDNWKSEGQEARNRALIRCYQEVGH